MDYDLGLIAEAALGTRQPERVLGARAQRRQPVNAAACGQRSLAHDAPGVRAETLDLQLACVGAQAGGDARQRDLWARQQRPIAQPYSHRHRVAGDGPGRGHVREPPRRRTVAATASQATNTVAARETATRYSSHVPSMRAAT